MASEQTLRPVHLLIIGLAGILPVAHSNAFFRAFMVPQQALLLVCLGILIAASIGGSSKWLSSEPTVIRAALASFALTVVWLGISAWLGVDPARSLISDDWQGISWPFWFTCLMLFAVSTRFRDELVEPVSKAISIAAGVLITLTIAWLLGGDAIQDSLVPLNMKGVPLPGIGDSAFLGAFCGAAALVTMGRWIRSKRPRYRLLLLASSAVGLMVLTQSRVSIGTSALLFIVGLWRSRAVEPRRVLIGAVALVAVGAMVQGVAVPNLRSPGSTDVSESEAARQKASTQPMGIAASLDVRQRIWGAALATIAKEPLAGAGMNNFSYSYRKYASKGDVRRVELQTKEQVKDAHSLLLESAAAGGIPAALGLLLTIVLAGWAARGESGRIHAKNWLAMGAVVLVAESMFQPLNRVALPLLAILGGLALPHRGEAEGPKDSIPRLKLALGALPVLASLLIAGTLMYSDHQLKVGVEEWDEARLRAAVRWNPFCTVCLYELAKVRRWDHVKEGRGDAAWALAPSLTAIERHPSDADGYTELGGGLLFMKRPAQALVQFDKAMTFDPHSWLAGQGKAVALLRLERFAEAVPYLQESALRNPVPEAFQLLAFAAEKAGMNELAVQASAKAKEVGDEDGR